MFFFPKLEIRTKKSPFITKGMLSAMAAYECISLLLESFVIAEICSV